MKSVNGGPSGPAQFKSYLAGDLGNVTAEAAQALVIYTQP